MTTLRFAVSAALAAIVCSAAFGEQPWQRRYEGEEATGPDVIALWRFDPGEEAKDNSGNGHDLTLRGDSRFVPDGFFGSALESFPVEREDDKAQGAVARNHPSLTPEGAFTLELWMKPNPAIDEVQRIVLLDKKYFHAVSDRPHANNDYCLIMRRRGADQWALIAWLGYGEDSEYYISEPQTFEAGEWTHVAFTYDGAGVGNFFLNGRHVGRTAHPGRGPVSPGRYELAIGDRRGSLYVGFPGLIDQVRIMNGIPAAFEGGLRLLAAPTARTAFLRMEAEAAVAVDIFNDARSPAEGVKVAYEFAGRRGEIDAGDVASGEGRRIAVPVDASLRPDQYLLSMQAAGRIGGREAEAELEAPVHVVARPAPNRMPVILWGMGDFEQVTEIGFTHQNLGGTADFRRILEAGEPIEALSEDRAANMAARMNRFLLEGLLGYASLSPGRFLTRDPELRERFQRLDSEGNPYERENTDASLPEVQDLAYNTGASVARTFGDFPALQAGLIHTEVRDRSEISFRPENLQAFRDYAGFDIPHAATNKRGVRYFRIPGFPENRVIPDDHPILVFYKWFWKDGDGWNPTHTRLHQGLHTMERPDFWTWFDPAVRVPSIWGSGGDVDVISQWTYTYPDPIKIGQAADELFAMAEGRPGQEVMKMTQIIWKRHDVATAPLPDEERAAWEREHPDARYFTLSPDHLRAAFWSKISRPVRGIMYHGWGSLVQRDRGSYTYTHPEAKHVLKELVETVVRPLGPTLLQVPDRKPRVALLESFASQMFAGRGSWGWGRTWVTDMHLVFQWAQIQPRIVYDETVLRDGLDAYEVLAMPHCDVLTEGVARKVLEFQRRGGIIVGDEVLAPAISPDILLRSHTRGRDAQADKAALQAISANLRAELDPHFVRYADSDNPDVVVRVRSKGTADYVFAVNDRREFGDYVGQHKRVMEIGLPNSGTITLRRGGGYVYDLVRKQPVDTEQRDGRLSFRAEFGPGGGGVFMVTARPIARASIAPPQQARRGGAAEVRVSVLDAQGRPVDAVVPVRVDIRDAEGREAEGTGYYAADGGELTVALQLAPNDVPGEWTVSVKELASGRRAEARFRVE